MLAEFWPLGMRPATFKTQNQSENHDKGACVSYNKILVIMHRTLSEYVN